MMRIASFARTAGAGLPPTFRKFIARDSSCQSKRVSCHVSYRFFHVRCLVAGKSETKLCKEHFPPPVFPVFVVLFLQYAPRIRVHRKVRRREHGGGPSDAADQRALQHQPFHRLAGTCVPRPAVVCLHQRKMLQILNPIPFCSFYFPS